MLCLLVVWGLFVVPCAAAQQPQLKPLYWKERVFFIPYQVKGSRKLLDPVAKVQLLTSRTGADDWQVLEEAEPNVQGFSFHAPEDGEYWFALRHLDRRGQPWPNGTVLPQVRIVVDTVKPQLTLEGTTDATGELVVRYDARDDNLDTNTLRIEVRVSGSHWSPLASETPDIKQPNRLLGRTHYRAPIYAEQVEMRATIADHAGQEANATTAVTRATVGPELRDPFTSHRQTEEREVMSGAPSPPAAANPSTHVSQLPSQDWPTNNRLPESKTEQAPPSANPYTATQSQPQRTPARLVGDSMPDFAGSVDRNDELQTLQTTPLTSRNEQGLVPNSDFSAGPSASEWQPAKKSGELADRVVNSKTFDIEYDLESVGPWGVSRIELWGTKDQGRSWQSFGVDSDNRSPLRVTVPEAGTYGFRILVDGANSAGTPPPQSGDQPELTVSIDLQPPTAELLTADLGTGNMAGHLLVSWTASDTNLEPRPIALFYSSYPNGPWSTIASGLENTGNYTWRIERHLPGRFYLRLEARDTAGNLATYQTPTPIELSRPQPSGRLRGVRPIGQN